MNIIINKKYEEKVFLQEKYFSEPTFRAAIGARSDNQIFLDEKLHFYTCFISFFGYNTEGKNM